MCIKARRLSDLVSHRGGEYSVKTGYQLLCEEDSAVLASSLNVTAIRKFWPQIWKLKVPHKVRIFL